MNLGSFSVDSPYFLSPMAGYTDRPFRYICKTFKAGLTVSELISINSIYYKNKKAYRLMEKSDIESPFSIQLFGSDPDIFLYAAQSVEGLCDCIDINAGCPAAKVVKTFAGSYLLKDKSNLFKIIDKLKKHLKKPVSIKLRKGFDADSVNDLSFYKELENRGIDFIVLHPRLRGQFFSGKVDYTHAALVKDALNIDVVINGGIDSVEKLNYAEKITGCSFFMIGQAAIAKPYIFEDFNSRTTAIRNVEFTKNLIKKHFMLMVDYYGENRAIMNFRKFFHQYVKGLKHSRILKEKINTCKSANEVLYVVEDIQ